MQNQHTRELISAGNTQQQQQQQQRSESPTVTPTCDDVPVVDEVLLVDDVPVVDDVPLVELMYLVFTRMPGASYRRRLGSLSLGLSDVFRALLSSLCVDPVLPPSLSTLSSLPLPSVK